jgi:hypothetical protein
MAKNKVIKKISKKSLGQSVDTVTDYIDLISQMIAEYFSRRYKIEKKVDDIKKATLNTLFSVKKEFIKTVIESLFLATGLLSLIIGTILFMSKYVALEYLLIFYGLIVSIAVLLRLKVDI